MNNYQSQQLDNINSIIGFATSIMLMGFMIGMVKPMGKFFEPPLRPKKHLPRPIVKEVTVPGGSYWECVSCGKTLAPGTKVFKAGREVYCSIPCIKLPELHSSNNVITSQEAKGTCYEDAWRFLIKEEEGELVHGTVESLGKRIGHAWVELDTGFIYEPQTARFFEPDVFKRAFSPVEDARYTVEEAAIMVARVGKHGPWTDEERAKWLPKHRNPTLQQFIDVELEDLVSRYGYRPYGMSFEGRDILDGAIGGHLGGFIFLAEDLKAYWLSDERKARVLVKYTIAHEYSHLMVLYEGVEKYLPKDIEEKDKEEYLEGIADGFAAKWIGFTVEDIDKILEALDEFSRFREQV